jgi:hypothetical protein
VANRKDAAIHDMQETALDPAVDRVTADPGFDELPSRHHSVLLRRQPHYHGVSGRFAADIAAK